VLRAGWALVMYQTMLIPKPRVEKTYYSKICSEDPSALSTTFHLERKERSLQ